MVHAAVAAIGPCRDRHGTNSAPSICCPSAQQFRRRQRPRTPRAIQCEWVVESRRFRQYDLLREGQAPHRCPALASFLPMQELALTRFTWRGIPYPHCRPPCPEIPMWRRRGRYARLDPGGSGWDPTPQPRIVRPRASHGPWPWRPCLRARLLAGLGEVVGADRAAVQHHEGPPRGQPGALLVGPRPPPPDGVPPIHPQQPVARVQGPVV